MTKKKKMVWLGSLGIVVLLVGTGIFITAAGYVPCPGGGYGSFHRFGDGPPPFVKKEVQEFMLWRLDRGVAKLDLNGEQQHAFETFKEQLEKTMEDGAETRLAVREAITAEMEKESPDFSVVLTDVQQQFDEMTALVSEDIALLKNFYSTLDGEQRETVNTIFREKIAQHKKRYIQ